MNTLQRLLERIRALRTLWKARGAIVIVTPSNDRPGTGTVFEVPGYHSGFASFTGIVETRSPLQPALERIRAFRAFWNALNGIQVSAQARAARADQALNMRGY